MTGGTEPTALGDVPGVNIEKLLRYFAANIDGGATAQDVQLLSGGSSNLTYRVVSPSRSWVVRRPPLGHVLPTAHDMSREHRILSALRDTGVPVPQTIAFGDDLDVFGCPFYVMGYCEGVILNATRPEAFATSPAERARLSRTFIETLAKLHSVDYEAIGLGDFGKPDGYVERQVSGWTKRYHGSQTDDVPQVDHVAKWLAEHLPESGPGTIIHNDFKFDNLVMDPDDVTRVIGILDWEMTTIGDPLMDLGTSLSYWVQADDPAPLQGMAFGPTAAPGMLTRRELVEAYGERTGLSMSNAMFYFAYGLFKTAVVVQQIYYRYRQGLTKDERFAALGMAMKMLVDRAALAIESESI